MKKHIFTGNYYECKAGNLISPKDINWSSSSNSVSINVTDAGTKLTFNKYGSYEIFARLKSNPSIYAYDWIIAYMSSQNY